MCFVHLDVGEEPQVVPRAEPVQMGLDVRGERRGADRRLQRLAVPRVGEELHALALEERRLGGEPARLLVFGGQCLRRDLAGLHVGLVERVDADHRAGDGGADLPAHELLGQIVRGLHVDADDGLARLLEREDRRVLGGVGGLLQTEIGEDAVVAVGLGRPEALAVDGDDALALLAGGLGDELLEPCAEIVEAGRGHQRQLVHPSGFSSAGTPGAHAWSMRSASSRRRSTSRPITAAGTMPKLESAE